MNKCIICSKVIVGKKTQKYCSNGCRQESYRRNHNLDTPEFLKRRANHLESQTSITVEKALGSLALKITKCNLALKTLEKRLRSSMLELHEIQRYIPARIMEVLDREYESVNEDYSSKIIKSLQAVSKFYTTFHNPSERQKKQQEIAIENESKIINKIKVLKIEIRKIEKIKSELDIYYKRAENELKGILTKTVVITEEENKNRKINSTDLIINASEINKMEFDYYLFDDYYKSLIGNPSRSFKMLIYGGAGSGKSTFSMKFASYLAKEHGLTLYNASEEGINLSLQRKVKELGVVSDKLKLSAVKDLNSIIGLLDQFKFIFLDSATDMNITDEDYAKIMKLNVAIITIAHATKSGDYKGNSSLGHDPDIIIEIDNYKATVHKTRFK